MRCGGTLLAVAAGMARTRSTIHAGRRVDVPLAAGLLALLAPLTAALLWVSLAQLAALHRYPYPHDGLEGTLLHEARLLRAGEPLYGPLEPHRFISAPYPPLHTLALALADLYRGPHIFWSGRLLSMLALAATAVGVALLIRRCSGSWPAALIGATLFVSAPPALLWGSRVKPDLMALAFTTWGLLLTARGLERSTRPSILNERPFNTSLVLAAACFACAFFTKQTDVAGPLAAGLALLADDLRAWRGLRSEGTPGQPARARSPIRARTLGFAALYLALALGGWALLDGLTSGGYTLHVWWNFQRTSWWSPGLFAKLVGLLAFWWPAVALAVTCVALAPVRRALTVPAAYALVGPLTLLYAGEVGANHNHLLETHLALAIAAGCAVGYGAEELIRRRRQAALLVGLAGLQLWLAFSPPAWYEGQLAPSDPPERFLAFMRATPGEILADDTGLLLQASKPLRYDDPSTMGPAAASGLWDQRGLLQEIAARRFSAIMIPVNAAETTLDPSGRWTPEMLSAIREHYELAYRDRIYTFVPK